MPYDPKAPRKKKSEKDIKTHQVKTLLNNADFETMNIALKNLTKLNINCNRSDILRIFLINIDNPKLLKELGILENSNKSTFNFKSNKSQINGG